MTHSVRYRELVHAVQSGVAFDQAKDSEDGSPKHLRTGINIVFVEHAALVKLLIAKGVITAEEYDAAVIRGLEEEVARYEAILTQKLGAPVKLG